ncbi:MAG: hypothetical protein JWO06_1756 [Bacteroidota bacterium]|nr:hypothetical protein [Bacteroidota bacterium]
MEKKITVPAIDMITAERIRTIRKFRELKQISVARAMNISQQAYSHLETRWCKAKIGTLEKVCQVIKVDLSFLLAQEIPVTPENMAIFDQLSYAVVCEDYKRMQNKLINLESLIFKVPVQTGATVSLRNIHPGNQESGCCQGLAKDLYCEGQSAGYEGFAIRGNCVTIISNCVRDYFIYKSTFTPQNPAPCWP